MTWLTHHTESVKYYRLAADAEVKALNALNFYRIRTIGVTVVSAVSLYLKAKEPELAHQIAHQWLASELLPKFARKELENLLSANI